MVRRFMMSVVVLLMSQTFTANAITVSPTTSIVANFDLSSYTDPVFWQWYTWFGTEAFEMNETISIDVFDSTNTLVFHNQITRGDPTPVGGPGTTVPPGASMGWGGPANTYALPSMGTILISSLGGTFDVVNNTMGFCYNDGQGPTHSCGIADAFSGAQSVSAVPLPGALPLFATGIGLLGLLGWRRKRKQAAA